jgi:hypothetical protein
MGKWSNNEGINKYIYIYIYKFKIVSINTNKQICERIYKIHKCQ